PGQFCRMSQSTVDVPPKGGFSFDLCKRNDMLIQKGLKAPSFLKTGTTIVGLIFKDGVILELDALVILVSVSLFRYGQLTAAAASLPDWPRLSGYHCFDPSQETPFQIGDFKHSLHPAIKVMSQLLSSLVELISQGLICIL
ncbi:hypothetical protein F2Q68_00036353, partial [Brassica cretica]